MRGRLRGEGGVGDSHKKETVLVVPFGSLKSVFLVPLRVFGLKKSTAGVFAVRFRLFERKKR